MAPVNAAVEAQNKLNTQMLSEVTRMFMSSKPMPEILTAPIVGNESLIRGGSYQNGPEYCFYVQTSKARLRVMGRWVTVYKQGGGQTRVVKFMFKELELKSRFGWRLHHDFSDYAFEENTGWSRLMDALRTNTEAAIATRHSQIIDVITQLADKNPSS